MASIAEKLRGMLKKTNLRSFYGRLISLVDILLRDVFLLRKSRGLPDPTMPPSAAWERVGPAIALSGLERADENRRIDPRIVEADVPVHVRPGGPASRTHAAHHLATA